MSDANQLRPLHWAAGNCCLNSRCKCVFTPAYDALLQIGSHIFTEGNEVPARPDETFQKIAHYASSN